MTDRYVGSLYKPENLFYGYRQMAGTNRWGYGYINLDDDPVKKDPEYLEYLRLKDKFDKVV